MTEKMMIDRGCFERGCMGLPNPHERLIKEDEVVWLVEGKEWVGLPAEEVNSVYAETQEKVNKHWDDGGTTMMFPLTLYQAFEAKLRERNT